MKTGKKGAWAKFVTCGHLFCTNHCCCTVVNVGYLMAHKKVTIAKISNNACSFFFWGMAVILLIYHSSASACSNMPNWLVQWQLEIVAACLFNLESIRARALFMYQAVYFHPPPPQSAIHYSYHQCRVVILAVYIYLHTGFCYSLFLSRCDNSAFCLLLVTVCNLV